MLPDKLRRLVLYMVYINVTNFLQIMATTKYGTEGTMAKLVSNMPEVAYRALSNSMTSVGHPDSKDHLVRYHFMCLQNLAPPGMVNRPFS